MIVLFFKEKKEWRRLSEKSREILTEWAYFNQNKMLKIEERKHLAKETSLTEQQVVNFIKHTRADLNKVLRKTS